MRSAVSVINIWIEKLVSVSVRLLNDIKSLFIRDKVYVNAFISTDAYGRVEHVNWGDDINVFFIESISKNRIVVKNRSILFKLLPIKSFCCIGSIIGRFDDGNIEIWGSGLISDDLDITYLPGKIHSVRGPLTRQALLSRGIDCPPVYGDPALLVSRYYKPNVIKHYHVGIIPHYVDIDRVSSIVSQSDDSNMLLVKMRGYKDWHSVIDEICSCDLIISSSLHGLIIADSYGVPNIWARFSDNIDGGDFKYLDYFASVGRTDTKPVCIKSRNDLIQVINAPVPECFATIDYDAIFDSCPFRQQLIDFRNSGVI